MILPTDMTSRQAYLDSHSSLQASMDDFEAREFSPTFPDMQSQHSGFRSANASEYSEQSSRRSYSPPAWRKAGSGWFQHHQSLSPSRSGYISKESSPAYHDADEGDGDLTAYGLATRVPLPRSPTKGRTPSNSPEPRTGLNAGAVDRGGGGAVNVYEASPVTPEVRVDSPTVETPRQSNYVRFSTSLDVVQRTQPIEDTVTAIGKAIAFCKRSRWWATFYAIGLLLSWMFIVNIFTTPTNGPVPDIVKVAGLARSLEPAIYYSERGAAQIGELQDTGIAVWDLGESVRTTNMTSAPIIVGQLDQLSESIKSLAIDLTKFFAGVDGDIDNILLTMEWAQRELTNLALTPPTTMNSVWSNTHTLLSRVNLAPQGEIAQALLGRTHQQLTRSTLERVFNEYLSVLEESINHELTTSLQLFALFEAIDHQFLNLQRTVIREQDTQEQLENDFLSSLWTRVIGVNASKMRKYEKNRDLLGSVRDRTVRNKHVLVDHNQRLLQLQSNLEHLRRKLVSPLVRSQNSSTLSVEEQIRGLEGTYVQLKSSRETQRRKMMDIIYGSGERRQGVGGGVASTIGEETARW